MQRKKALTAKKTLNSFMAKPTAEFEEFTLYGGKVAVKFYPNSHIYMINGKRAGGSVTGIIGMYDKSQALVSWATDLARDHLLDLIEGGEVICEDMIYKACGLHEEKKVAAANIGTEVHDWVENYIKCILKKLPAPEMPASKEAQIGVNAFLDWVAANKVKFISSERAVYSKKHDFVGKMDIEAKVNGKLCLLDLKTSNALYNTYGIQTAAYVKADEEESERVYEGRWLLRLSKETEKEYKMRMDKKNKTRERKGKDPVEYAPYQVFEAKYLDDDETAVDRDFKAFLACKTLHLFEKETGYWATKK